MSRSEDVVESSGKVFADLGIADAGEALAKAELARRIGKIIRSRRLSQVDAGKLLGIDQPKISSLLRGRLSGFSVDRLLRFLNALDRDVEIVIRRRPPRSRRRARVTVVAV